MIFFHLFTLLFWLDARVDAVLRASEVVLVAQTAAVGELVAPAVQRVIEPSLVIAETGAFFRN